MSNKKVILITGGSDGLGKTIARSLKSSYQVIILSPTKNKVEKAASDLKCNYEIADVSNYSEIVGAIKKVVKKYGRLDCLINNAGLWIQDELDKNDPVQIERILKVNCLGVIYATKAAIPQMKKQKQGIIININSQSGWYAKEERSVYVGSKWAVTGFTKSIQPELAKYGIKVTGIHPGGMKTSMFAKTGNIKDQSNFLDPEEVAKTVKFILSLDSKTVIPEIGIKHINN